MHDKFPHVIHLIRPIYLHGSEPNFAPPPSNPILSNKNPLGGKT